MIYLQADVSHRIRSKIKSMSKSALAALAHIS